MKKIIAAVILLITIFPLAAIAGNFYPKKSCKYDVKLVHFEYQERSFK